MDRLHLKYISEKDDSCYFKITNPDEFLKKYEYKEDSEAYYPMFKSKDGDDYLLKVKSKYLGDSKIDKENKDAVYDTAVSLKDFRMQSKDKKLKYGKFVNHFKIF
jgi:hypothetical protein